MAIEWSKRIGLVLAAVLLLPATASAYSNLYVLGDSLSDTGNLYAATGSLPQPPYVNGRFSNGPIYAEYLWPGIGLSGRLAPSYLGGTDYAVGGARSRYHAFDTRDPSFDPVGGTSSYFSFSLLGQRDAILADYTAGLDPKALYTVWSGSNDVSDAVSLWPTSTSAAFDLVVQAATDFVTVVGDLVAAGAHYLLIPNLPNLGLVPEAVAAGPDAQYLATQLAQLYNNLVAQALLSVSADITRLDTFAYLSGMVADPAAYGLPVGANVAEGCFSGFVGVPGTVCSNPENYLFWDSIHPSASVHEELGRLAVAAVAEPSTLLLVALALLALLYSGRRIPRLAGRCLAAGCQC